MPVEIRILAWGAVLLVVYILAATQAKNNQYGLKWNIGARDETQAAPNPVTGRLIRAQQNFIETFPVAIVALIGVVVANRTNPSTALGGWIWLGARAIYLPLYAAGIPFVRTIVWGISIVGLVMVISPLLFG